MVFCPISTSLYSVNSSQNKYKIFLDPLLRGLKWVLSHFLKVTEPKVGIDLSKAKPAMALAIPPENLLEKIS